jgi:anti-sigma regulatory factor (Ser/Thr protein kinase)
MSTAWLEQENSRRDATGLCRRSLTVRFDSDIAKVPRVVQRVISAIGDFGWLPPQSQLYCGVALEEALLNAVIHGNLEVSSELRESDDGSFERMIELRRRDSRYGDRLVTVEAEFTREQAEWCVRDQGPGFNVRSLPDPRSPERIGLQSGRGVLMMRTFMDEVAYNESGNEVRLVKRPSGNAAGIPVEEVVAALAASQSPYYELCGLA